MNKLDKFVMKNKWTIEYDTVQKERKKEEDLFGGFKALLKNKIDGSMGLAVLLEIIVKDEKGNVVITKEYDGSVKTEELDEIIYNEIIQLRREQKLKELLG
jgi:hypothetical protein